MVPELLFLLLRRLILFQLVLEIIDTVSRLLAVVGKALDLTAALHTPRHFHPPVHFLRDHAERGHILACVVAKIEVFPLPGRSLFLVVVFLSWCGTTVFMLACKRREVFPVDGLSRLITLLIAAALLDVDQRLSGLFRIRFSADGLEADLASAVQVWYLGFNLPIIIRKGDLSFHVRARDVLLLRRVRATHLSIKHLSFERR